MKTDLYTKIILTVIALALTINLIKGFSIVPKAHASTTPQPSNSAIKVNIVEIGGYSISDIHKNYIYTPDWACIPVKVK